MDQNKYTNSPKNVDPGHCEDPGPDKDSGPRTLYKGPRVKDPMRTDQSLLHLFFTLNMFLNSFEFYIQQADSQHFNFEHVDFEHINKLGPISARQSFFVSVTLNNLSKLITLF